MIPPTLGLWQIDRNLFLNYFSHSHRFLDDPYFVAGTAVPDWLSVVDRKVRARKHLAEPFMADCDPIVASVAGGIVQHHKDDDWFHRSRNFVELSLNFTVQLRDLLAPDDSLRPSFLGHILVELLLDDWLIQAHPDRIARYYSIMDELDAGLIQRIVNRMATKQTAHLQTMIGIFCRERFLYDYHEDDQLLVRLNQVMRRVRLPALPASFTDWLPTARVAVNEQAADLLTAPV